MYIILTVKYMRELQNVSTHIFYLSFVHWKCMISQHSLPASQYTLPTGLHVFKGIRINDFWLFSKPVMYYPSSPHRQIIDLSMPSLGSKTDKNQKKPDMAYTVCSLYGQQYDGIHCHVKKEQHVRVFLSILYKLINLNFCAFSVAVTLLSLRTTALASSSLSSLVGVEGHPKHSASITLSWLFFNISIHSYTLL